MSGLPTYAAPTSFLSVAKSDRAARYCVAGIPYDIGTSFRSGARFGPEAIRAISRMLLDGDNPADWVDPQTLDIADIGNFSLRIGDALESMRLIEEQATGIEHLIGLGGDHSLTLPLLRALTKKAGPVGLIHFDAHVDTWPDTFGQTYGHGSIFYHAIQEGLVDPRRMIQIGIRSPMQRAIYDWTRGKGVEIVSALDVHLASPADIVNRITRKVGDGPTYLSFDIDCIDPSQAPGTGTPEVGGLFTWQVMAILRGLAGIDFRGMDVVEVAPAYDHADITALAAASIAWQYLALQIAR
ncbi:MAG TPA: agmatinase [Dongiaceae bacterium]|jgi:agmatinase|nr:agmatinase [Dongiaceae bacterium]